MNKKNLITIFLLPLMWCIYFGFEFICGNITTTFDIVMNFIFIVVLCLIGYILNIISIKYKAGLSNKKLWILFFVLMLLDQGSKLIIKLFFFNDRFEIIPNFLSFHPIINTKGSWLNVRFGTSLNFPLLIFLNVLAIFFFIEFYRYYTKRGNKCFWSDICFISIISGCLCSFIDKVFYGGSLDFIGISTLFIADLKDIYINLAIFAFILTAYYSGYLTSKEDSSLKEDIIEIKKFFIFILKDIKILK